jgi:hypothetical protein
MNWQNQHCKNNYTTKSNLCIQCDAYQNPNDILHRNRKINPKIHMETQKTFSSLRNSQQKVQCWRYHKPDFKLYYRAITTKTAWFWHKNRHKDQQNRIEDPDISPHSYRQLIFYKRAQNPQWRRDWISICRRLNLYFTLYQYHLKVDQRP